jgi:formiminotetrahydrofolate cyclodeaminase
VVTAYQQKDQAAIRRSLKAATEVPLQVALAAASVLRLARHARAVVSPKYRSDLTCVEALAAASRKAAEAFMRNNLTWLKDPAYSRRVHTRLAAGSGGPTVARARA